MHEYSSNVRPPGFDAEALEILESEWDAGVFGADADVFDPFRELPAGVWPWGLSFGYGTHACLGLHVAKMEGKVCLEEVLAAWPEYEVDLDGAERLRTEFVQGFASLPIRF